jgi:hypothetical protein
LRSDIISTQERQENIKIKAKEKRLIIELQLDSGSMICAMRHALLLYVVQERGEWSEMKQKFLELFVAIHTKLITIMNNNTSTHLR